MTLGVPATVIAYTYETSDIIPERRVGLLGESDQMDVDLGQDGIRTDVFILENETVGEIVEGDYVYTNVGSVNVNNGNLEKNNGGLTTNNTTVLSNFENEGQINLNTESGVIIDNAGTITDNFGTVGGAINSSYWGDFNDGSNTGTVINNYDNATVVGTAPLNQYWSVTISAFDNGSANLSGINKYSDVTEKYYILDKNNATSGTNVAPASHKSGTITITPANGFKVSETTGNAGPTTCQFSLARSGNSYVVTISAVDGVTDLTLAQLNLMIEELGEGENVVVRVDPSIRIVEDETGSNRAVSDTAPATGNVVTAAQISAMIESALAANPGATVLDLDLGNDPSFTADTLIALCEKSSVAKNCHFTHNGMKFVLFIPVVDPTSAAYQQCKALLDAEEGKQAGPIRLSHLFKPVGFNCLGE